MDIDRLASHILRLTENASPEVLDLFLKNQPLAYSLAKKAAYGYSLRAGGTMGSFDPEDFSQEALLALYKAAEEYKPELGLSFTTLAHKSITNAIRNLVRKGLTKARAIVSTDLDAPVSRGSGDDESGEESAALDFMSDPKAVNVESREDSMATLRDAINHVTRGNERDRAVLMDLLTQGNEFDLRDAGAQHGVSHTYVQNIINKYTPKLKKFLNDKGLGGYDEQGTMVPTRNTRPGEYSPRRKKGAPRDVEMAAHESLAIARFIGLCQRLSG